MEYSKKLFKEYRESHTIHSGASDDRRVEYFETMFRCDYQHIFEQIGKTSKILEIGCNVGTMLGVLRRHGYINLEGIDLSPDDLKVANEELPKDIPLHYADAFDFLRDHKDEKYDCIFSRAVFEHIKKERLIELLELCKDSLAPGGVLVVDVPNMDWLIAYHERYMDFTHECGYNSNSLGQVMRSVFGNCEIYYTCEKRYPKGTGIGRRMMFGLGRLRTNISRYILGKLFMWSLETPNEIALFSKCIVGVCRKVG